MVNIVAAENAGKFDISAGIHQQIRRFDEYHLLVVKDNFYYEHFKGRDCA